MTMKQVLGRLLAIVAWASVPAMASTGVPPVSDLSKDAAAARAINGAVLVAFVGEHCGYCERVLNEFLIPMSRNADYQGKLVMRRLETSGDDVIRDFDGKPISARRFANRYTYSLVPTVMLFDNRGRLLAKPLVGLTTVDYYGMYLDEAIDAALVKIRGQSMAGSPPAEH